MAQAKLGNLNLKADLSLFLIIEVLYMKDETARNHACMFVFYCENIEGEVADDDEGEYEWVERDNVFISRDNLY